MTEGTVVIFFLETLGQEMCTKGIGHRCRLAIGLGLRQKFFFSVRVHMGYTASRSLKSSLAWLLHGDNMSSQHASTPHLDGYIKGIRDEFDRLNCELDETRRQRDEYITKCTS